MAGKDPLGKGIQALFEGIGAELVGDNEEKETPIKIKSKDEAKVVKEIEKIELKDGEVVEQIKVSLIEPNKNNARKYFDEEKLNELAESIRIYGLIQPIIVAKKDGYYEIIAGERRWRASKIAGLKTVPCIVNSPNENDDKKSLIENLQRADLNPVEKALGYKELMDRYELTKVEFAKTISRTPSSVSETLSILNLTPEVLELAKKSNINETACRALLEVNDPQIQLEMAEYIIEDGLSADEARKRLKVAKKRATSTGKIVLSPIFKEIEEKFEQCFGAKTKLKINSKNVERGQIMIKYNSNEELTRMLEILSKLD